MRKCYGSTEVEMQKQNKQVPPGQKQTFIKGTSGTVLGVLDMQLNSFLTAALEDVYYIHFTGKETIGRK